MSSRQAKTGSDHAPTPAGPTEAQFSSLGKLSYLAGFCPLHRTYPASTMAAIFFPAVSHGCVRFFQDDKGATAAALIWARLSHEVSERMLHDKIVPTTEDWVAGDNLWFLDLLAPFGHGVQVARHIARNPPEGPFYFARLDRAGNPRKVVLGDATKGKRGLVQAFAPDREDR